MRDRYEELRNRGGETLVVSFSPPHALQVYQDELRLPFPVTSDPDRIAYEAYGVGQGPAWRIWSPDTIWRYVTLVARGRRLQRARPDEDVSQLGADFVVDPEGVIRYAHVSRTPADRPSVDEVLGVIGR